MLLFVAAIECQTQLPGRKDFFLIMVSEGSLCDWLLCVSEPGVRGNIMAVRACVRNHPYCDRKEEERKKGRGEME